VGALMWKDMIEMYPGLVVEMNGMCIENSLSYYYQINPVNKVHEFKDEESELDFSEILNIDMDIIRDGESKQEKEDRKSTSYCDNCDNSDNLQEKTNIPNNNRCNIIIDINEQKEEIKRAKEEIKRAKKERRQERLSKR
jgi:hypothetical protein